MDNALLAPKPCTLYPTCPYFDLGGAQGECIKEPLPDLPPCGNCHLRLENQNLDDTAQWRRLSPK
jgi:hypothetical protein